MKQDHEQGAGTIGPQWEQYGEQEQELFERVSRTEIDFYNLRKQIAAMKKDKSYTFAEVSTVMARMAETARRMGGYFLAAPEELLKAGADYFHAHADAVREALTAGGASPETVGAVMFDYGAALCGLMDYRANPLQMAEALRVLEPDAAYKLDKYGLFMGLLCCYQRCLNALSVYTKAVKKEPNADARTLYFIAEVSAGEFTDLQAAALYWLRNTGYITTNDFEGVDQDAISKFLTFVDFYGENGKFIQYVFIARRILNATPEQLAAIPVPPLFFTAENTPIVAALDYAAAVGEEMELFLKRVWEQLQNAKFGGGVIEIVREPKTGGKISFSEDCALMLSRPLYASTDGKQAREILPISAFIADYAANHVAAQGVTPSVLEKTVEAVNLLQQFKRTTPANGIYTLKTNLTEFARLYGYEDANEQQKQQILTALHILHNLYIVIWKPTGRVAVQLFGLQQYGLANGNAERELVLNVFASGFRGRPQFWDAEQYALLRKQEKGAAMRHYRNQIISKGQAKEEDLLLQIFEYGKLRDEANRTGDAGQIEAVTEFIRKHKSRDKKRLRRWFDDWQSRGYISYSVHANKNGEIVYKWKRLNTPPEDPEQEQPKQETKNDN